MLDEDLDDTHLCIKCSATIVGLDNYIQHRKTNCGSKTTRGSPIVAGYGTFEYLDAKTGVEPSGGKNSKTLSDPYDLPYELGANVFFSSLQLQSVQANTGGKANTVHQILTRKATATLLSSGRGEAESGDWQEEAPTNNAESLMKVVRDIGETKKFETIFKPITFAHESPEPDQSDDEDVDVDEDFEEDDDDDEDYVPTPFSGGKWKPGSQPAPNRSRGKWKSRPQTSTAPVPANHTGGKWKAASTRNSKWKHAKPLAEVPTDDLLSQIRAKLKSTCDYIPKEAAEVVPETGSKWKPGFFKFCLSGKTVSQEPPEVLVAQTGGKWKPGDGPEIGEKWKLGCSKTPPIAERKCKPPEGHESPEILESQTGGKWKPGDGPKIGEKWKPGCSKAPPIAERKCKPPEGNESPEILETQTGGKWKPGERPSTGLKWKTDDQAEDLKATQAVPPPWGGHEPWGEDAPEIHPPLEHTKGKWVPGTKVERLEYKEEVLPLPQDFWCNICCRKLANKYVYENHLKSGIHSRRFETEQQLERAAVEQLELSHQILRPPELLLERRVSPEPDPGKRKRRKIFIKCEICKHRMPKFLVGKHLISHYHYVRMILNPIRSLGMILDNIHQIVLQSPFQCSPCRFYSNTEENFLNHWNSVEHRDQTEGPGKFWCSFCRFECEDTNQMRRHLLGADHKEVILAINRSVPICISKKVTIECPKCHQQFRFNVELRQHAIRCEGTMSGTATDEYQAWFRCELCPDVVIKSKTALHRHEKFKHNKSHYHCFICSENFETAKSAEQHRKTNAHRKRAVVKKAQAKPKSRNKIDLLCKTCDHVSSSDVEAMLHQITHHPDGGENDKEHTVECAPPQPVEENMGEPNVILVPVSSGPRKCIHCIESFNTRADLKCHLNTVHPEEKHVCQLCGEKFTLPHELGCHKRYRSCVLRTSGQPTQSATSLQEKEQPADSKKSWKCSDCMFSSVYESELIFHRIVHTDGVDALKYQRKLKCPLCEKSFSKHSLRCHLRQHTNEKIFVCEICKASFSRRHNYKEHLMYVHSKSGERKPRARKGDPLICDTCGKSFVAKAALQMHMDIHAGKKFYCPEENCQYSTTNAVSLKAHKASHLLKADFKCPEKDCKYKGKSEKLLKRHQLTHSKVQYECPECDFMAKLPLHIKRHIRVHTKECPYKCPHCDYKTGYIENLRKHVLNSKKHAGKFIYQCALCDPAKPFQTNYNTEYQAHLMSEHNIVNK